MSITFASTFGFVREDSQSQSQRSALALSTWSLHRLRGEPHSSRLTIAAPPLDLQNYKYDGVSLCGTRVLRLHASRQRRRLNTTGTNGFA